VDVRQADGAVRGSVWICGVVVEDNLQRG
jgi:hypothetical protein